MEGCMSTSISARPAIVGTFAWLVVATAVGFTGVVGALSAGNVFGMIDLIVAVTTAGFVVARGDVPGMEPLLRLPLVLVPIFAVPLLFATHIALFRRLWPSIK